jgi:PII-like signaling protein
VAVGCVLIAAGCGSSSSGGPVNLNFYSSPDPNRTNVKAAKACSDALDGATCLRGVWGFHGDHPPRGDRVLQIRRRVPIVTVIVDSPQRIARSFQIVDELTDEGGLVTSEMVPAMAALDDGGRGRGGLRLARHRA